MLATTLFGSILDFEASYIEQTNKSVTAKQAVV
jgi:hypothetical protein